MDTTVQAVPAPRVHAVLLHHLYVAAQAVQTAHVAVIQAMAAVHVAAVQVSAAVLAAQEAHVAVPLAVHVQVAVGADDESMTLNDLS